MKYLLIIHMNPANWEALPAEVREAVMAGHEEFIKELTGTGELLGFAALADPSQTRTARVRDGELTVTDGPYLEAKEWLAGYYAIEAETPERAYELAGKIPDAKYFAIEVRPIMASSGLEM
ncbi:YciI family protein [Catellatospora sp. KI3]|uniref:YciI family protein n=1 Tax=Catellatospora sp. KI3 TaxID=3041620 RepID=UPI002482ED83|nr:YciI family protein [Catellatospora sp. KI3]MDI1462054.1 YciI family protein [Catellatospora sp. KI3]